MWLACGIWTPTLWGRLVTTLILQMRKLIPRLSKLLLVTWAVSSRTGISTRQVCQPPEHRPLTTDYLTPLPNPNWSVSSMEARHTREPLKSNFPSRESLLKFLSLGCAGWEMPSFPLFPSTEKRESLLHQEPSQDSFCLPGFSSHKFERLITAWPALGFGVEPKGLEEVADLRHWQSHLIPHPTLKEY